MWIYSLDPAIRNVQQRLIESTITREQRERDGLLAELIELAQFDHERKISRIGSLATFGELDVMLRDEVLERHAGTKHARHRVFAVKHPTHSRATHRNKAKHRQHSTKQWLQSHSQSEER